MNKLKLLVVEDNISIIGGLQYLLEKENFEVVILQTKKDAINFIDNNDFDFALLDVELPDGSGFEICKYIKQKLDKPVIIVSARIEELNIVYGLDIGADDYVIKPFGNNELIARINSVLRRYTKIINTSSIINYKNIKIDIEKAKVYKDNKEVNLTKVEYKILLIFLNNIDKLVTREKLLEEIWDIDGNFVNDNTLTVYIKRLRTKLEDEKEMSNLQTIRGIGYILRR